MSNAPPFNSVQLATQVTVVFSIGGSLAHLDGHRQHKRHVGPLQELRAHTLLPPGDVGTPLLRLEPVHGQQTQRWFPGRLLLLVLEIVLASNLKNSRAQKKELSHKRWKGRAGCSVKKVDIAVVF